MLNIYTHAFPLQICLINGTYKLPDGAHAESHYPKQNELIRWYALTPLLIVAQTIPFAIPCLIWMSFNQHGGIEVSKAIENARTMQESSGNQDSKLRTSQLRQIANNINRVDMRKRQYPKVQRGQRIVAPRSIICLSSFSRIYLSNLYLAVKSLYLLAVVVNFGFIASFLGTGYFSIGIRLFGRLTEWKTNYFEEIFPLEVLCRSQVKDDSITKSWILQCLLTMNMYNEKLFLGIWYWYFTLLLVGTIDLALNIAFRCSKRYRMAYFRYWTVFLHFVDY